MNTESIFKSLHKYQDLFAYQQSEQEAQQVNDIGQEIRGLRAIAGYSRRQLAEALEIDFALLTAIEIGVGNCDIAEKLLKAVREFLDKES
jgi:ribosome-binding protein aMBF1 (putative translation factor)